MFVKYLLLPFLCGFIEAESQYFPLTTSCRLPQLLHGRVKYRQRKIAKFMCSVGYELVGNRYGTCRNGEWDVPTPVCVRPGCPELPSLEHGLQISAHHGAWVVNFCVPGYELVGSTAIYCNGINWNSTTFPQCVKTTGVQKPNLSCDFEDESMCGWTQDERHDFDWLRINHKVPSFIFTGPQFDHTYGKANTGYFMYIESSYRHENDTARLLSPIYDASYSTKGCFSMFYHMYGKGIGGLRVYQKPDSLQLQKLLEMPEDERQNYIIFEKWGNLGTVWYQTVSPLKELSEDFQIVIEGIRGNTYASDIAIDDVSLMQGDNCTAAKATALEPPVAEDSCQGRCGDSRNGFGQVCECVKSCTDRFTCCSDYIDTCVNFDQDTPQTAELVGESTTTALTTKITTTTQQPTTTSTTTTTTTTKKPTTTLTTSTTTKRTTTKSTTTPAPTTKLTTKKIPITTKKLTTKKVVTTTRPTTTTLPTMVIKTVTDSVDKVKKDKNVEGEIKPLKKIGDPMKKEKSSTWKTAIITILILATCAILLYVGIVCRGSTGLLCLNRLRGRISHDSEVRYLTTDHDEL